MMHAEAVILIYNYQSLRRVWKNLGYICTLSRYPGGFCYSAAEFMNELCSALLDHWLSPLFSACEWT